ncbi:SapC family protein [Methylobacterium sp. J-059]|uniref:SapC family protein n=1 Tax=Methylobacterium sp. J-059 TaxID=2836643 RepID=UPI001FB9C368|nr:SapC family protein [Methylobacterium sp. J-059]MCJ2038374.1 SapC family protein [Methylobacterium sp. J-059]
MAKQLLIYERATALSRQRHADWSVKLNGKYNFARDVNSVPLMVAEFPFAASEYAIVFGGQGDEIIPVALLGVRDNENLQVAEDGGWTGKYVPAFLRRYPFVFSSNDAGDNFTLCIDEHFDGFNAEGRGERLFDSDGHQTQYLRSVLGFLQAYQVQFQHTKAFTKRLEEFGLLESMQAELTLRSGQKTTLTGFMTVNRERLKALSADKLALLMHADELELIYLHLQSLQNFAPTAERVGSAPTAPPPSNDMPSDLAPEPGDETAGDVPIH